MDRFVPGFKTKTLLNFFLHHFHIFEQVVMGFYALSACHLNDLDTVVTSVHAGSYAESAAKETVLDALHAVVHGGS